MFCEAIPAFFPVNKKIVIIYPYAGKTVEFIPPVFSLHPVLASFQINQHLAEWSQLTAYLLKWFNYKPLHVYVL